MHLDGDPFKTKTYKLKQKNLSVKKNILLAQTHKRRQIKLQNFLSIHFYRMCFDTYENALIKNFVILFAFFCAFEPIEYFF